MSALPRPELAPGPSRTLNDALHDLHHRAGWPSLRALARDTGVSHTTVSKTFSAPTLPTWGTLELVVEALDGDTSEFHDLWLAASTPADRPSPPASRIAGRKTELAAVRRHLETGTGLLLVTGEAGIGKTRLVTAGADTIDTFVAVGRCLPLSTEVPLMPVVEVLRIVHGVDDGQWFKEAVAECPTYVAGTLAALLPEIDTPPHPAGTDEWARQRLFAALSAILTAIDDRRRLAVVLDDLHWADRSTLELLEYLTARGCDVAVVGTWRRHDPNTDEDRAAWLDRVRRQSAASTLDLGPLDRAETALQLELLGRSMTLEQVDALYDRTLGHPLFTAQLAVTGDAAASPAALPDLFDVRLRDLADHAWRIVRALGLADRALPFDVLEVVTDLRDVELTQGLRVLAHRNLLDPADTSARLAHPLVAEAVRRLLVPGEAVAGHARLARALADRSDASPAEVAAHYRAANDPTHEFPWRLRAAEEAQRWNSPQEESGHWLRALDIWPEAPVARTHVTRAGAQLAAVNALNDAGREPAGLALAEAALASGEAMSRDERFELAIRAAGITWGQHGPDRALELLDDAQATYGDGLSPDRLVRALRLRSALLSKSGHNEDALAPLETAVALSDRVTDPENLVGLFATHGWHLGFSGDLVSAVASFARAEVALSEVPTPERGAYLAMMHTDVLLFHGRPPAELERVASSALRQIKELDLRSTISNIVRSNVAEAWLNAGRPARAAELLVDEARTSGSYSMWPMRTVAARVELAQGHLDEAVTLLSEPHQRDLFVHLTLVVPRAEALLWMGRTGTAVELLTELLERTLDADTVTIAGHAFVMLARATADARDSGPSEDATRHMLALRRDAMVDPLGPGTVPATRPACTIQWESELARVALRDTVDHWVRTATQWDLIGRRHDAAYCRWRGAQVALRQGQGTLAARLLRKAATDASEHVPLSEAIARTAGGAR